MCMNILFNHKVRGNKKYLVLTLGHHFDPASTLLFQIRQRTGDQD